MALINTTSVAGIVLLLYLSSFILLAILRIATGVSIQRIGYFSLRHISFVPKEGIRVSLRGLGLALHRPSYLRPTWVSLVFTELKITIDPSARTTLKSKKHKKTADDAKDTQYNEQQSDKADHESPRDKTWKQLIKVKEKLKQLHHQIKWLRMIDLSANNTILEVVDVGYVQISEVSMAVRTRKKLLDRGRHFRRKNDPREGQRPAEWVTFIHSVLLSVDGQEPVEVLDALTMDIHGLLYPDKAGLRDISVSIKAGRLYIPVDDALRFMKRNASMEPVKQAVRPFKPTAPMSPIRETTSERGSEEPDTIESIDPGLDPAVADAKKFLSSVLHSIQEIQIGLSWIRISKELQSLRQANLPLVANIITHEMGLDIHRVQQDLPAHRMYFQRGQIAHQALLAAVSLSIALDEDGMSSDKIMYTPMATTTIRTTLPAQIVSFDQDRGADERNSNVLFGNLVVTSPSVDLRPQHMIKLLALTKAQQKPSAGTHQSQARYKLISKLLPRAVVKVSINEPVMRFVLPVANPAHAAPGEFDMIISNIASISWEAESSHSAESDVSYSLASGFRLQSHQLYYQSCTGIKHNLFVAEALELKLQVTASKEIFMVVSGYLTRVAVLMVRDEVVKGIYNIVRHFKRGAELDRTAPPPQTPTVAFLRKLPPWILELHFEGSDCSLEVAGVDQTISKQTRGLALQLESWSADYHAHRAEVSKSPGPRRKASLSIRNDESLKVRHLSPPSAPSKQRVHHETDGRRLAVHIKGLEGYIIEALDLWEHEPFLSMPRFEVALSTTRDHQGPVFHVHSTTRALHIEFSLYRFYSIGVAHSTVQDALKGPPRTPRESPSLKPADLVKRAPDQPKQPTSLPLAGAELVSVDAKITYLQLKMQMPHDPDMMLQVYDFSVGWHRWSAPFVRSQLIRLNASAPHLRRCWVRIVSTNNVRVDFRKHKKKTAHGFVEERSFDLSTDFIRLAVPHGIAMYKVFDNFVNVMKSTKQLRHRFKTRTNEYILKKEPEGPAKVPRVSLRCRALMFELEDDPFEWKLGVIYHVGLIEQKLRLARQDAFNLKVKKLNEERIARSSNRYRAQSHRRASPAPEQASPRRSRSHESFSRRRRSTTRNDRHRGRSLRYDAEGTCDLSGTAKLTADEAYDKLQEHNARSWKKRVDWMFLLQNNSIKNLRRIFSGADEPPHDFDEKDKILAMPNRHGLLSVVISDLHLVIDKPSFPLSHLPQFLHDVGKGMPLNMEYSLLVPLSISLDMGEARVLLRDYPLNLLRIPAIRPGQPPRLPSWSLRTDFVVAEEFRDDQSIRHVKVDVIPKGQRTPDGEEIPGFSLDVRRTVSPVKTYSMPVIDINTSQPTIISWGTSYQPVIQDMMMIIEGFTKPEIDASDRVGFWDKIRLNFHSRLTVNWKEGGDVHLRLKGSRSPYVVTGYGAGFVMCWRNNVQFKVHSTDDPKKFMMVDSGEYVLAVPDYSAQARSSWQDPEREPDVATLSTSHKNHAVFKKVIAKLSGNVRWTAGLVFERDLDDGSRSLEFKPHYEIVLKNPASLSAKELEHYDAFRGFRSQHIHLAIDIAAPHDRDWLGGDLKASESYNSVHLSPRFFTLFFDWWALFSGVMSLPIRQGLLWRGPEKKSKKFGRNLATIKYSLLLSPLFIAHVYKHKDAEDYKEEVVSATGLKIRLDSFVLDLHQRREYFDTLSKGRSEQMRTSAMKINQAEVDFIRADIRAVSASITGTSTEEIKKCSEEQIAHLMDRDIPADISHFEIPDSDYTWIDMDDFVELDWVLPAESNPDTKILPLMFTPRFTYFRQTDHAQGHGIQGDESRVSPFGEEDTHFCIMSRHNDPRKVQMELIQKRLADVQQQLAEHTKILENHEVKMIRDGDHDPAVQEEQASLETQQTELQSKHRFLEQGLRRLKQHVYPGEKSGHHDHPQQKNDRAGSDATAESDGSEHASSNHVDIDGLYSASHDEFASDFNNRFIIHNAQLKWSNALRNTILRYSHQVSQRRGFIYYMSRKAVRFILDIVDEQAKVKEAARQKTEFHGEPAPDPLSPTSEKDEDNVIQDRIQQLLDDAKRFVKADDDTKPNVGADGRASANVGEDIAENIAECFLPMNSYHMRLVAPQIQLQSEKNTSAAVLITTKGMQLKVISIMDKARLHDEVSGLVQRRFAVDMDGAQFFVTSQKLLAKNLHLYSGNLYGNQSKSSWPPWVSLEDMFDFQLHPFGFQRIISKTSASLRYEKYNPLRLKHNEEVAKGSDGVASGQNINAEHRIDQLWISFPRVRAVCDSAQYYAMYVIALDLLLFSEPLQKTRSERLEKIMLASDFSDLRGAPEMAQSLQCRIRQLEDIKLHFQVNAKYLDKQGWEDRIRVEKDLASCEDELFFIMKAISTAQARNDERRSDRSTGLMRWYLSASEVVWHLMREKNEPLLEFQLANAAYERIDNSDGSNHNALEIEHIRGWNLLPGALYPEIIAPYHDPVQRKDTIEEEEPKMVQIHWHMLEAIAGIPVVEHFSVSVHPLRLQIERELGKNVFEYVFPTVKSDSNDENSSPFMVKGMEPIDDADDEEAEEARRILDEAAERAEEKEPHQTPSSSSPFYARLKPTFAMEITTWRPGTASSGEDKSKGLGINHDHYKNFFKHNNQSHQTNHREALSSASLLKPKTSEASLRSLRQKSVSSTTSLAALANGDDNPRSGKVSRHGSKKKKKEKPSDDVTQMMSRASNYMILAHVKLRTFVVCLSYKGKGDRNIEDLRDFVFRMPTLEYRNKTWSNLDLALRLKKDIIRALISHTGAIIGNKISHYRPSSKQLEKLRVGTSNASSVPVPSSEISPVSSETGSLYSFSQTEEEFDESKLLFKTPSQMTTFSTHVSPLARNKSWTHSSKLAANVPRSIPHPTTDGLRSLYAKSMIPQGRNLLKGTLGRHFSSDPRSKGPSGSANDSRSSLHANGHMGSSIEKERGGEATNGAINDSNGSLATIKYVGHNDSTSSRLALGENGSGIISPVDDSTTTLGNGNHANDSATEESDGDNHTRKSVLLLGKKVLGMNK